MDLLLLLEQSRKVKEAAEAGKYVTAWGETLPIQDAAVKGLNAVGIESAPASKEDQAKANEIKANLTTARDACDRPGAEKIGDGTLFKLFLDALLQLLPIFLPIIVKP